MGRSITCTFQVHVVLSNGTEVVYGAMSFKQVRDFIESEKEYQNPKGIAVCYAKIWPQTKRGENQLEKDFAVMTHDGKTIDHYYVTDTLPLYTFE